MNTEITVTEYQKWQKIFKEIQEHSQLDSIGTTLPAELLALLANDINDIVRIGVANNTDTSSETLALLAYDENEKVRLEVARNKSTPANILAKIGEKCCQNVQAVIGDGERKWDFSNENEYRNMTKNVMNIAKEVAQNPNTSAETLKQIADIAFTPIKTITNIDVYTKIAQHPNTSAETLAILADAISHNVVRERELHRFLIGPWDPWDISPGEFEEFGKEHEMYKKSLGYFENNILNNKRVIDVLAASQNPDVKEYMQKFNIYTPQSPQIPVRIGNVNLTAEQQQDLRNGKTLEINGLTDKHDRTHSTVYVSFNNAEKKIKISCKKPDNFEQKSAVKETASTKIQKPQKHRGMRM